MAEYCYLCRKRIGIWGRTAGGRLEGHALCGTCIGEINGLAILYGKGYTDYTLEQTAVMFARREELKPLATEYAGMQKRYQEQKARIKQEIADKQHEIQHVEETVSDGELANKLEILRAARVLRTKKESFGNRRMQKRYEKAQRRGDDRTVKHLEERLNADERAFHETVDSVTKRVENLKKSGRELIASAETKIAGLEELFRMMERFHEVREFIYRTLYIPDEKEVPGMENGMEHGRMEHRVLPCAVELLEELLGEEDEALQALEQDDHLLAQAAELVLDSLESVLYEKTQVHTSIEERKHLIVWNEITLDSGAEKDQKTIKSDHEALQNAQNELEQLDREYGENIDHVRSELWMLLRKTTAGV